jgi:pimeloyl-ACP methyl ester carboxylesterase
VAVSRSEIERITSNLTMVQRRLLDELEPMAQLSGVVHHIQLDLKIPDTLVRLGMQRHGCFLASESYFTGEARVAHQLGALADVLHENPALTRLIPKEAWVILGATTVLAGFSNSNLSSQVLRATASEIPKNKLGLLTSVIPSERVTVVPVTTNSSNAPRSIAALTDRLNNNSGNIRLESYQTNQGRVVVVYLPGTANWSLIGGKSAFDLRSNVELVGDSENSNSSRAAHAAINAFGVTGSDRLILVGYSQGGMVATELARENPNVIGVVTVGSPIANEPVPNGVPILSIEHSNDVVPALAGETNPLTENWATATKHWELKPGQTVLDAHSISAYVNTSSEVDKSTDLGLARIRNQILGNLAEAEAIEAKEFQPLKATS